MSDKATDRDLALLVSAVHKLTKALDGAGMNPAMLLTQAEIDACTMLSGYFPGGPVDTGDGE